MKLSPANRQRTDAVAVIGRHQIRRGSEDRNGRPDALVIVFIALNDRPRSVNPITEIIRSRRRRRRHRVAESQRRGRRRACRQRRHVHLAQLRGAREISRVLVQIDMDFGRHRRSRPLVRHVHRQGEGFPNKTGQGNDRGSRRLQVGRGTINRHFVPERPGCYFRSSQPPRHPDQSSKQSSNPRKADCWARCRSKSVPSPLPRVQSRHRHFADLIGAAKA